jgi:hypothetical protein
LAKFANENASSNGSLIATASDDIQDALEVIHQFNVDLEAEEVTEMKAALTTVIKSDFWPKLNALTPVLSFEQEMEVHGNLSLSSLTLQCTSIVNSDFTPFLPVLT